jgi:hypothetical protein
MVNISCICDWRALDGKGTIHDEFCRLSLPMSYCGEAEMPALDEPSGGRYKRSRDRERECVRFDVGETNKQAI